MLGSGNLIDLGEGSTERTGIGDYEQSHEPSLSPAGDTLKRHTLGPEPELLNKAEIQRITTPKRPARLRSIDDTDFSALGDQALELPNKDRLLQVSYGLAAFFVIAAVVALVISKNASVDARPLGSFVFGVLTIQVSLRAMYPPNVSADCCVRFEPGNARRTQNLVIGMLAYLVIAAVVGWFVSLYGSHAFGYGAGVFLFVFADMVLLGAEEKRMQMVYSMGLMVIMLLLTIFILYEEAEDRSVAFDILSVVVMLVHCPMQMLSITGRWTSAPSSENQGHQRTVSPMRTAEGLPIRRVSTARIDEDDRGDDVQLISHD